MKISLIVVYEDSWIEFYVSNRQKNNKLWSNFGSYNLKIAQKNKFNWIHSNHFTMKNSSSLRIIENLYEVMSA